MIKWKINTVKSSAKISQEREKVLSWNLFWRKLIHKNPLNLKDWYFVKKEKYYRFRSWPKKKRSNFGLS